MTALSNNINRPVRVPAGGITTEKIPLAGYTNYGAGNTAFAVYKGAPLFCDVTDTDGYFSPAGGANAATGDVFGGIAMDMVAVTSADTADGSKSVTVATDGIWGFPKGSLAQTDIGATIYASDTNTVTSSSTNAIAVGICVEVDATYAWIDISDYWMRPI